MALGKPWCAPPTAKYCYTGDMKLADILIHRTLRVPYFLHVRQRRLRLGAKNTYVFIHGLGDTGELWANIVKRLPSDVNYVVVDLLGFGLSPKPDWALYDAKIQARSVLRTCVGIGIFGPVTVIGHSLGSLVAVEFAKRYPFAVSQLVLCSPPVYDTNHGPQTKHLQQQVLQRLYADIAERPKLILNAYAIAKRLRIINQSLEVTPQTLPGFLSSLQASIVNQDTLRLLDKIRVPVTIINGLFDVLTISAVLREIVAAHPTMRLKTIATGHEINKLYENKIIQVLGL